MCAPIQKIFSWPFITLRFSQSWFWYAEAIMVIWSWYRHLSQSGQTVQVSRFMENYYFRPMSHTNMLWIIIYLTVGLSIEKIYIFKILNKKHQKLHFIWKKEKWRFWRILMEKWYWMEKKNSDHRFLFSKRYFTVGSFCRKTIRICKLWY